MNSITVLYDEDCPLCRRARSWLEQQPQHVRLEFVAAGSPEARRRFPELDPEATLEELNVVSDRGQVFRGDKAWLVCLWSLRGYRGAALALARPKWRGAARRLIGSISKHRRTFPRLP